jgi:hypothetical protein
MTRQEERKLELELQNPDDHRHSDEWDGPDRIGAGATSGATAGTDPATGIVQGARYRRQTGALESVLSGDVDRPISRYISLAIRGPVQSPEHDGARCIANHDRLPRPPSGEEHCLVLQSGDRRRKRFLVASTAWQTPRMANCRASLRPRQSPTWPDCTFLTTLRWAMRRSRLRVKKISLAASAQ